MQAGKEERKDTTRTQGRPGLCLRWLGSSAAIWLHSCALPPLHVPCVSPLPPPSPPPLLPPQPLGHWQARIGTDPPSFPQHSLQASLNRVAYAWVHTLHLSRKRLANAVRDCNVAPQRTHKYHRTIFQSFCWVFFALILICSILTEPFESTDSYNVRQPVRVNFPAVLLFQTEPKLLLMSFNLFFLWLHIGSEPPRATQRFGIAGAQQGLTAERERERSWKSSGMEKGEKILGFLVRYFQKIVMQVAAMKCVV